jgi:hypothetical protein
MSVDLILESTKLSTFLIEERSNKDIVIGAPHHAPAGQLTLPCPEHYDSDENVGFLARYLAEELDCCNIIACNYTIDVNKSSISDYTTQIVSWSPKVLVEIHGHGGIKAKSDIEISSGNSENDRFSKTLSNKLAKEFALIKNLKHISICGEYEKLYFKASGTKTIGDARWIAYHIELPPELRKTSDGAKEKPPKGGYEFCDALAKALQEIHRK